MGRVFYNKRFSDYLGENRAIMDIVENFVPDIVPSPTPTPSTTPTNTPTPTPSITPSNTPSVTPTNTPSTTPSNTPSITPSITPSVTPSITPSSSPGPTYDTDAKAYLEAVVSAGGTVSPVMSAATDTMFKQLKSNNLYTKLIAFYPYMGGTGPSHRINANLNTTYNLSFEGGWTHGISGSTPNGTNGYADTGYAIPAGTASGSSCDLSFGIYLNNFNGASGSYDLDMGTRIPDPDNTHIHWIGAEWAATTSSRWASAQKSGSYVGEPSVGFYTVNRIRPVSTATIEMYKNGSLNTTDTQAGGDTVGTAGSKFYLGCISDGNVAKFFSKKTQCFTFIASYMNTTETPIFMNIINNFQTSLGRNTY